MPSPYVKKLSKETGKSVDEIEALWTKAKNITAQHFDVNISDFGDKEYSYTVGVVKNMVGLDEKVLDVSFFLESDKSAAAFIEDISISGPLDAQIGPDPVIPPEDKDTPVPYKKKEGDLMPPMDGGNGPMGGPMLIEPENDMVKDDDTQAPAGYADRFVDESADIDIDAFDRMFDEQNR